MLLLHIAGVSLTLAARGCCVPPQTGFGVFAARRYMAQVRAAQRRQRR